LRNTGGWSGEHFINGSYDHYHMYVEFEIFLIQFWFLWCKCVYLSYMNILQARDQAMVALVEVLQFGIMCMWVKFGNLLLIWFPFIWFLIQWCNCVSLSYWSILEARKQAIMALVKDLHFGIWCMWVKNGNSSPFEFSLLDLTLVDSNVVLISLETF
jgi:hypothetical protein